MHFRKILLFVILGFCSISGIQQSSSISKDNLRLYVFQGSDWCSNCIRLERQVLQDSQFLLFAKRTQLEVIRIDFPQRIQLDSATKKYNEEMAEKYDFKGVFPTVILVNKLNEQRIQISTKRNTKTSDFIAQIKVKSAKI